MSKILDVDFAAIRAALAELPISPSVPPNADIGLDRAFFPEGHRGVLDLKRQVIVGNRGMGKSFWTHALLNAQIRERLAKQYRHPELASTEVAIGFNGSERRDGSTPTIEDIRSAKANGKQAELIWRAVVLRVVQPEITSDLEHAIAQIETAPNTYAEVLTKRDDELRRDGRYLLIVFDALDRLAQNWDEIRDLTKGLLIRVLGLQSFRSIRAKVFMRVDQFSDETLFTFPDSSKVRNDKVDLAWQPRELYGLLFFELTRSDAARPEIESLAEKIVGYSETYQDWGKTAFLEDEQAAIVSAIAGEFMGGHKKRGRLYTWVPLHLSDAANNCSPRTFITAWKSAASHTPKPKDKAVDHLGIAEGVRQASQARLAELQEDYPWIKAALLPLKRKFVPIPREDLFLLWDDANTVDAIVKETMAKSWLVPIDLFKERGSAALLKALTSIAVMEERSNGKINVPDIFRVEAEILRRGGVSVPRKS
jgi:hypothetical protein